MKEMDESILELLSASCLVPATCGIDSRFLSLQCLAICMDDKPIALLGGTEIDSANTVAKRLLECEQFNNLLALEFGYKPLKFKVVNNKDVCKLDQYDVIFETNISDINSQDARLALVVLVKTNPAFCISLCAIDDIVKCFNPDAADLPMRLRLQKPELEPETLIYS